jgi:outer membrane protein OmpA-like peptidoglycan-associated protein
MTLDMNTTIRRKTMLPLTTICVVALAVLMQVLSGCQANNATKGGAIGAGAGGVIGGVIGSRSDNTAIGAIIGAAAGGATGVLIGRHMDKQAEQLRKDLDGATVERIGEGILITFESGLLFKTDSYDLQQATKINLSELAGTLIKYDDTNVLIEGHTDNTGTDDHNQGLSERRADAVEGYLVLQGVGRPRLTTRGYGESQPVDSNGTTTGRSSNRRVEVAIYANEKMKRLAKKGELI